MKPYYQDEQTTIYHGDCFEVLPTLVLGSVDLVLTDPDYNGKDIGVRKGNYSDGVKVKLDDDTYKVWCQEWFRLVSCLTDRIAFTSGIRNAWNYPPPKWMLAWYKPGAVCYNAFGGFNIWEPVLVYGKGPKVVQDAYESTPLNLTKQSWSDHPCPKHPGFWRWVLAQVGRPGETVLDPFLGSGTTARVAKDLGLKCIGIELEERWCEMAVKRLAQGVLL